MLFAEMMFACVSCRPDIGCVITLMSKFRSNPSVFHHHCLKSIAKYLRATQEWGIIFHQKGIQKEFPNTPVPKIPSNNHNLPQYPTDTTDLKLVCFVDAVYGNNPTKRQLTTGCAHLHIAGVPYCISLRHNS